MTCRGFHGRAPAPFLANFTWDKDVKLTHFGCVSKPWRHAGKDTGCFDDIIRAWRGHFDTAVNRACEAPGVSEASIARFRKLAADTIPT
jgi:hypothetical protein